jgi:transposase
MQFPRVGVDPGPVPADHLGSRPRLEAGDERVGRAVVQDVDRPAGLDVDQQRPVTAPLAQRELVDDFAVRRGQSYNTILIDMDTRKPVDVLPDREAATLAAWLREHPEVHTVCRDRGPVRTPRASAPEPRRRFKLPTGSTCGRTCARQRRRPSPHTITACAPLSKPSRPPRSLPRRCHCPRPTPPPRPRAPAGWLSVPGHGTLPCTSPSPAGSHAPPSHGELNLDIQTVRRFANAACAEELLGKAEHRSTRLDPCIDLVNRRWNEGVTSAETITAELRALGFKGDAQTVRRYLKPLRLPGTSRSHPDPHRRTPAPAAPAVPKPRAISKALLTHPDRLTEDDEQIVKNATAGCAHLERLQQHVRSFAKIMAQRRGAELPAWLEAIEADDLPELRSLAAGMRRDLPAVINGLTLEHNSGAVEGNVTRVKRLKRDGYGRANFDLLRAQILIAA